MILTAPQIIVVGSVNLELAARVDRLPVPGETVTGADATAEEALALLRGRRACNDEARRTAVAAFPRRGRGAPPKIGE